MIILYILHFYFITTNAFRPPDRYRCNDGSNYTGMYLIIAPQTIRPNAVFTASISILPDFPDQSARVGICRVPEYSAPVCDRFNPTDCVQTTASPSELVLVETEVSIRKNSGFPQPDWFSYKVYFSTGPTQITLTTPKSLSEYRYDLCATITSGASGSIEERTSLFVSQRTMSVFIQTDKAKYNPGNTVKYRVAVVDANLKPYKGKLDIKITDPSKNIVQLKRNVQIRKGVATETMDLSTEPSMGAWTIAVKVDEHDETKTFTIEKYVLPKFEVKLDYDTAVQVGQDFQVFVEGVYTYGKPLKGQAKLIVERAYINTFPGRPQMEPMILLSQLQEDGKAKFDISGEALTAQRQSLDYMRTIKLTGVVIEDLTGITRNMTSLMTLCDYKYQIKIEPASLSFKPGLSLPIMSTVEYPDGRPASLRSSLRLRRGVFQLTYHRRGNFDVRFLNNQVITVNKSISFSADGKYSMVLSDISPDTIRIIGKIIMTDARSDTFGGSTNYLALDAMQSPAKSFVQITNKNNVESYDIGQFANFNVKLTKVPIMLGYQVVAKGVIVMTSEVPLHQIQNKEFNLQIPITHPMTPSARLIVYGVMESGASNSEVIGDGVNFNVNGLLRNKVSLSFNPTDTKPFTGEVKNKVELKITADPNSFVGLLAVDKSVKLLGNDNDITEEAVENAGSQYDSIYHDNFFPFGRRKRQTGHSRVKRQHWRGYVGGSDVSDVFRKSGLTVLTDSLLFACYFDCMACGPVGTSIPDAGTVTSTGTGTGTESPQQPAKRIVVREEFPETWLWLDMEIGRNGSTVYRTTVPDTITTWKASAFAMNEQTGMGVSNEASLRVFRPFFVSLGFPYSIKRGEQLALQVLVFNYNDNEELVRVELEHNPNSWFQLVPKPDGATESATVPQNIRYLTVPSQGSATVFFPIIASKLGEFPLVVKAYGDSASDGVKRNLRVEPVVIDLTQARTFETEISISDVPANIVMGSDKSAFSVVGDLMGPVLSNIDELVRMPYGCGEQNMVNFVPNIVVLDYLTAAGKLTKPIEEKAIRFMKAGYQRELNYKRNDHSFSAFGQSDSAGSTWLTAFVVWSFAKAKPYIEIEQSILDKSIRFLEEQQTSVGVFDEKGEVHNKRLQGGSGGSKIALTAYVVLTLLENGIVNDRAIQFIENNLVLVRNDPLALAMVSYALQRTGSSRKDYVLNLLERLAVVKDLNKFWQDKTDQSDTERPWWYTSASSGSVEMTSYALLTYSQNRVLAVGAFPIVRWLIYQRNENGGFGSTQVSMPESFSKVSKYVIGHCRWHTGVGSLCHPNWDRYSDLTVTVQQGPIRQTIGVNNQNSLILQKVQLAGINPTVKISASGRGMAYAQVSYRYNVHGLADRPPFTCSDRVLQLSPGELILEVCCSYALNGRSNMALLEAETLSGFKIDVEKLDELTGVPDLQRVETSKDDTKAAIYFNSVYSCRLNPSIALCIIYRY